VDVKLYLLFLNSKWNVWEDILVPWDLSFAYLLKCYLFNAKGETHFSEWQRWFKMRVLSQDVMEWKDFQRDFSTPTLTIILSFIQEWVWNIPHDQEHHSNNINRWTRTINSFSKKKLYWNCIRLVWLHESFLKCFQFCNWKASESSGLFSDIQTVHWRHWHSIVVMASGLQNIASILLHSKADKAWVYTT
jgi:hypothetical protein